MNYLTNKVEFPDVSSATKEGLVAIGGDLSIERLVLAYNSGIFPWFNEDAPILWWSPNPRFVLFPDRLKVSKSMRQILRKKEFKVTYNIAFEQVIKECSHAKRKDQPGTWITSKMIDAYIELHHVGIAKSVEVWKNEKLVGGLYGVDLGTGVFCGESMFSAVSNASKVGFISWIQHSNYQLIDCQLHTNHLESLGAEELPRDEFLNYLH